MIQPINNQNVTLLDIKNKILEIKEYLARNKESIEKQLSLNSIYTYEISDSYYKKQKYNDYNIGTLNVSELDGNIKLKDNSLSISGNVLSENFYNNQLLLTDSMNSYLWKELEFNNSFVQLKNSNELLLVTNNNETIFVLNESGDYEFGKIKFKILDDNLFIDKSFINKIYYR